MMIKLRIAENLSLPLDAATQTFAIFGKRGSGKTNGATVIVEELLAANLPVVILDPVDVWWGLKSSFDGKKPGLPIYVFGGQHQDLPLESTAGALMADVVANEHLPMILSMKEWGVGERARFVTDFAKRLLQVNSVPVMMVLEEADAFIPQRPAKGEEAMLGAMDRLVRWGRSSGVGCTLVTQRSAKVNKDVTTQAETLIAFRTTGPQDRDAIDDWIKFHAGEEKRADLLSSLAVLPTGTGWVWSPEWLDVFDKVAFRRRETYDSAATPKVGEKRPKPKQLAAVDLDRLRAQMATTVEAAKQNDPRELRKKIADCGLRIADLEKQLAARPVEKAQSKTKEVPVLSEGHLKRIEKFAEKLGEAVLLIRPCVQDLEAALAKLSQRLSVTPSGGVGNSHPHQAAPARPAPLPRPDVQRAAKVSTGEDGNDLTRPQQRILDALASLEALGLRDVDKSNAAVFADQSPRSSAFMNNIGRLRTLGLIHYPRTGRVALTDIGRGLARSDGTMRTLEDLHSAWYSKLSLPKQRILGQLILSYPTAIKKEDLAQLSGASVTSSAYMNNLGNLRSLGLIDYPQQGHVAATELLFPPNLP